MPVLQDPRHELFAQARVRGEPASKAYVTAGFKRNDSNAARLNGKEPVKTRIAELQEKSADGLVYTLHKLKRYQEEILDTPAGDVHPKHKLCQEVRPRVIEGKDGKTETVNICLMPDKGAASVRLAHLHGWGKEVSEVGATSELGELLLRIRGAGLPREPKP